MGHCRSHQSALRVLRAIVSTTASSPRYLRRPDYVGRLYSQSASQDASSPVVPIAHCGQRFSFSRWAIDVAELAPFRSSSLQPHSRSDLIDVALCLLTMPVPELF